MSDEVPEETYTAIMVKLARIETVLEQLRRDRQEAADDIRRGRDDHEGRIRALERWRWSLPTSLLTAVVSAVIAIYSATGR